MVFVSLLGQALLLAAGMIWQVAWSLVLGFTLSGLVQTLVSKERMQALLGRDGIREIALATGFGGREFVLFVRRGRDEQNAVQKRRGAAFQASRSYFRRRTSCWNSGSSSGS